MCRTFTSTQTRTHTDAPPEFIRPGRSGIRPGPSENHKTFHPPLSILHPLHPTFKPSTHQPLPFRLQLPPDSGSSLFPPGSSIYSTGSNLCLQAPASILRAPASFLQAPAITLQPPPSTTTGLHPLPPSSHSQPFILHPSPSAVKPHQT